MMRVAICALTCALAGPFAVQAAPLADDVAIARAPYSDLDLSRSDDAKIMARRLDRAALEACGASRSSFRDYRAAVQRSDCYKDGVRRALGDLNAPAVTQASLGQAGIVSASN